MHLIKEEHFVEQREKMIENQLKRRGIKDQKVLDAVERIPREMFVLPQDRHLAYEDNPLPIGFGQTISQPYIVAYMIEQLDLQPTDRVLEIGTGSGYAAAIMSELCKKVYTLEVVKELYKKTPQLLSRLHYKNVVCYLRDGYEGLSEEAPFDKIVLTAAPENIPQVLIDQLKVGGKMIAPTGSIRMFQRLILIEKHASGKIKETELMGVSFVEMVRHYS